MRLDDWLKAFEQNGHTYGFSPIHVTHYYVIQVCIAQQLDSRSLQHLRETHKRTVLWAKFHCLDLFLFSVNVIYTQWGTEVVDSLFLFVKVIRDFNETLFYYRCNYTTNQE